jgi:hypothetical protein
MAVTYYQQHPYDIQTGTLTVGDLLDNLAQHDRALPVIFRSPMSGCYGPRVGYSIDSIQRETLPGREEHHPATAWFDEEEGVDVPQEAYTDVLKPWDGVVIA